MSSLYLHSKHGVQQATKAGFGLVELMVSISIMAIVTAIVFTRQDSFNGAVLLRGQAYEIALAAREVQQSAVSATGMSGDFRIQSGMSFDTATTASSRYVIFRDADNDGVVDANEPFGQQGSIDPRFEIRAIRGIGDTVSGSWVSVIYKRPDFDAVFFDSDGVVNASSIEIDVARKGVNGAGAVRTIEFTRTGQITVKDS